MLVTEELLHLCEQDIRAGRAQEAARRLSRVNTAKIPRHLRLPLAQLCRRANLISLGAKVLTPVIQASRESRHHDVSPQEFAEYASLLQRIGAVQEALSTLKAVDASKTPDAHLFTAFCHFQLWDYEKALPSLEAYVTSDLPAYWRFVGRVNLAAALVALGRYDRAMPLIGSDIEYAAKEGYSRLQGNLLELRAQALVMMKDVDSAKRDLESAMSVFGMENTPDQFFVKKWQAILNAAESGSIESLKTFRAEALSRDDWESVRDADLRMLKIDFEMERFEHLLFGTPFAAYRKRILAEVGRAPSGESFVLGHGPCFDVLTGEVDGKELLNMGKKSHQLLEILLRDFYRPLRIGSIFAELFPGEYFDIFSSPMRVHSVIKRLRAWFEEHGLPLEISEFGSNYRLVKTGEFSFRVPLERRAIEGHHAHFEKLRLSYDNGRSISTSEARELLGMTPTSFKRFASWALESGLIAREGNGRATTYKIVDPRHSRAA